MTLSPHSLEWLAVRKQIDKLTERARELLEDATDPPEIYRLQGRIRGLQALITEIEEPD
jgi:hypothetical protein